MQVFRTSEEIRMAPSRVPALEAQLSWLISELEEEGEPGDQVNIIVAGPGDRLEDVNADLGFDLREEPAENVECLCARGGADAHLNGEGSGYWLFVPMASTDLALLELCTNQLPNGLGARPAGPW